MPRSQGASRPSHPGLPDGFPGTQWCSGGPARSQLWGAQRRGPACLPGGCRVPAMWCHWCRGSDSAGTDQGVSPLARGAQPARTPGISSPARPRTLCNLPQPLSRPLELRSSPSPLHPPALLPLFQPQDSPHPIPQPLAQTLALLSPGGSLQSGAQGKPPPWAPASGAVGFPPHTAGTGCPILLQGAQDTASPTSLGVAVLDLPHPIWDSIATSPAGSPAAPTSSPRGTSCWGWGQFAGTKGACKGVSTPGKASVGGGWIAAPNSVSEGVVLCNTWGY